MPGAIAYYDWLLPQDDSYPFYLTDSSTGGTTADDPIILQSENMTRRYTRSGIDQSSNEYFALDVWMGGDLILSPESFYGCIAALGITVDTGGPGTELPAFVTITIDDDPSDWGDGLVYAQSMYVGSGRQYARGAYASRNAVAFPWADEMTEAIRRNGGVNGATAPYIRIRIEAPSEPTAVINVSLNRVMVARCLFSEVENGSTLYTTDDPSEVQRSYAGYPFVSKKPIRRRLRMNLVDLKRKHVVGNDNGTLYPANIQGVNAHAGASSHVIVSPRIKPLDSELIGSNGDFPLSWTNEHMLGLMEDAIDAQLISVVNETARERWSASVQVTETPLP